VDGVTRREALKIIYRAIVAAGCSSFISFEDLLAADANPDGRINVVWLHGSSCSGCSTAFLNIEYVPVLDILTKYTNIIFHPDISLATGDQVTQTINTLTASELKYVFVIEGGIPVGMPHACMMADKPLTEWVDRLAGKALACVAAGTCAALGGIPKMRGTVTGSMTLPEYLKSRKISKPVVNIPGCPMKPEHLVYTVLHFAKTGTLPDLTPIGTPRKFFSRTIHEKCIYYADFQEDRFANHIGDEGCLLHLGCQGPVTRNDCLVTGYNNNTNVCIRAGHPCVGCAGEHFPRRIMLHTAADKRAIMKDILKKGVKA
jgi:hydrogenase small subunit